MRAFEFLVETKKHLSGLPLTEGGNLTLPGGEEAEQIDLKVTDRKIIVPILNQVLGAINSDFAKRYKTPLWSPELLQSGEFLSGSSLHFFNVKGIDDETFVAKKPKVGDIDTQVDKQQEANLEEYLNSIQGKIVGPSKFLGYKRGNEQFSSLWELTDVPIKVQIDLEFVDYAEGKPTPWSQFSHSSSWDDLSAGIKGVFHKYLMRAFTTNTLRQRYIMTKTGKIQAKPVTSTDVAFAVASGKGGGMRQKYEPVIDPDTGKQLEKEGLPVFKEIKPEDSTYVSDIGGMFEIIFGRPPKDAAEEKLLWSFTGGLQLAEKNLSNEGKTKLANGFIMTLFGPTGQGLYRNDPARDKAEKMVALDTLLKTLNLPDEKGIRAKAEADAEAYYAKKYKVSESITEDDAEVQATTRQNMVHLQKMGDLEFIEFAREIKDKMQGKLNDINMSLKIDGLGARFGKDANGRPFFESSRSGPIFTGGVFSKHAESKGFTGEKLERAKHYDDLFDAITKSGFMAKLPNDTKVVCEILYNPMAEITDLGLKFVTVSYDRKALGSLMSIVPFHAEVASTGQDHPKSDAIVQMLLKQSTPEVRFIDPSLEQSGEIDVNAIIDPVLSLNDKTLAVLSSRLKVDREEKLQVKAVIQAVKDEMADFIIKHPSIVGKDKLGKDIEGLVVKPGQGRPFKVTTPDFKSALSAKMAARQK